MLYAFRSHSSLQILRALLTISHSSAEDHRLLYGADAVSPEELAATLRDNSTFHDPNAVFNSTLPCESRPTEWTPSLR